jgi:hypothetical protein
MAENATVILKVLMLGICILVVVAACASGSDTARSKSPRSSQLTPAVDDDQVPTEPGSLRVKALDWSAGPVAVWMTTPISPPHVEERNRLAKQFLAEKLTVWQERMELEDWRISIALFRSQESHAGPSGKIQWNRADRSAVISVLDASQYYLPFGEMLIEMEATLVNELVRLNLASIPRSQARGRTFTAAAQ